VILAPYGRSTDFYIGSRQSWPYLVSRQHRCEAWPHPSTKRYGIFEQSWMGFRALFSTWTARRGLSPGGMCSGSTRRPST
jgi:hypothetical protein